VILCYTGPTVAAFNEADNDHALCARFLRGTGPGWWFRLWRSRRYAICWLIPQDAAVPYDLLVAKWDPVQPQHVRQAAAEYDRLGRDHFLALHHFGTATAYLLILDGKSYDSKAILGVAYQPATGRPLGPHDFSGGVGTQGAARVLHALGFKIRNFRDSQPPSHS
jgi:hypothetical protein